MQDKCIKYIFFSPTQSTKKILSTIVSGITPNHVEPIDLTLPVATSTTKVEVCADLVVIGVPVYAGRVPIDALQRLNRLQADNVPAVIVVVYGNRAYDDALLELNDISIRCGFKPIAGGAFVAEHSFSTAIHPIAKSRPDQQDLDKAHLFGKKIAMQYKSVQQLQQLASENIPGGYPYRERKPSSAIAPETDKLKCQSCHKCVVVCPTGAILKRDNRLTDPNKCILCGACIKACKHNARSFTHPAILELSQRLSNDFTIRQEPEIFI